MEELKQKLVNICNESGLPLEAIVFVARDFYRDVVETWETFQKQQNNTEETE